MYAFLLWDDGARRERRFFFLIHWDSNPQPAAWNALHYRTPHVRIMATELLVRLRNGKQEKTATGSIKNSKMLIFGEQTEVITEPPHHGREWRGALTRAQTQQDGPQPRIVPPYDGARPTRESYTYGRIATHRGGAGHGVRHRTGLVRRHMATHEYGCTKLLFDDPPFRADAQTGTPI